jgi:hypothetical protein
MLAELSEWLKSMDMYHYNTTSYIARLQQNNNQSKLGELTITPRTWQDEAEIKYVFGGVFPSTISGISYQSDNTASTIEINVEFTFLSFDILGVGEGNIVDLLEGELFEFTNELINGIESGITNIFSGSTNSSRKYETHNIFGFDGFSNFTRNIPQYAASTISKGVGNFISSVFKF